MARKRVFGHVEQWQQIKTAPFNNSYLRKKFGTGTNIIFENQVTKEVLCLNRSIVDPTLNYNKGGFDMDKDLFDNDYEHLYES